jgi:hypothetical protein
MNTRIESLALIHRSCWLELGLAAHQQDHAFRLMGLATINGDAADLRTVVLREVIADAQRLVFFTDARSPKVRQMQAHPEATLMVWCAKLGWQLRLRVRLEVEVSGLAVSSRWARLKMTPAAMDYLSPLPPGTPVERYLPERATREQFAVVSAQVQAIDWLELHADGHRRAMFDAAGNGQWVTP